MLGVALVVDDVHKGPKLAFSYPNPLLLLSAAVHTQLAGAGIPGAPHTHSHTHTHAGHAHPHPLTHGHALSSSGTNTHMSEADKASAAADYFAKLFRPKPALCNQPFRIAVQDCVFISFPVALSQRSGGTVSTPVAGADAAVAGDAAAGTAGSGSAPTQQDAAEMDAERLFDDGIVLEGDDMAGAALPGASGAMQRDLITMFNVVFIVDPQVEIARARQARGESASETVAPTATSIGEREACAPPPSTDASHPQQPLRSASAASSGSTRRTGPVQVATGDEKELSDLELQEALLTGLTDVAQRLAACLLYEEGRCAYVSRQSQLLLNAAQGRVPGTITSAGSVPGIALSFTGTAPAVPGTSRATQVDGPTASGTPHAASPTSVSLLSVPADGEVGRSAAEDAILAMYPELQFSLPWELTYLFHHLKDGLGSVCHLRINNFLTVSLSLSSTSPNTANLPYVAAYGDDRPSLPPGAELPGKEARITIGAAGGVLAQSTLMSPGLGAAQMHGGNVLSFRASAAAGAKADGPAGDEFPHMMPIRPYHTILLLEDTDVILRSLPPDSSPQLVQLVLAASPLISFNQLQGETGIPSSQLLRLAAHLVHWGLAIIINVITHHSVYTVSPTADLAPSSALVQEFNDGFAEYVTPEGRRVDGFTLASVLALFSRTNQIDTTYPTSSAAPGRGSTLGGASSTTDAADSSARPELATRTMTSPPLANSSAGRGGASNPVAMPPGARARTALPAQWIQKLRGVADGNGTADASSEPDARSSGSRFDASAAAGAKARAPPSSSAMNDPTESILRSSIDSLRQLPRLFIGCGIPLRVLMSAMPRSRATRFISALTWLLKHGFLRQMHTYVYLVWPWPMLSTHARNAGHVVAEGADWKHRDKASTAADRTPGAMHSPVGNRSTASGPAVAPLWTSDEQRYIHHIVRGKPTQLVGTFLRVLSYLRDTMGTFGPPLDEDGVLFGSSSRYGSTRGFREDLQDADGMHPILKLGLRLEEIMWRLRISRSDLQAVLAAFPEVLVTSIHE